nr:MAG TPA: hypothetical protein [Caudoviricetes sp.]
MNAKNVNRISAASNGAAAVAVIRAGRQIIVERYAPAAVGSWERRDEFRALVARATAKLLARERAAA